MSLQEGIELNVNAARWVSGYQLEITFSDGTSRLVDFEVFLKEADQPEVRKYLEIEKFKGFTITFGNLVWNDYDLCFSIEDLYSDSIQAHRGQTHCKVAEDHSEYRADAGKDD